jgi:hypothetical protein
MTIRHLIENNQFELLDLLSEENKRLITIDDCCFAAHLLRPECLEYCLQHTTGAYSDQIVRTICEHKRPDKQQHECLRIAMKYKCPVTPQCMDHAIFAGRLDLVKLLHTFVPSLAFTPESYYDAVSNGHAELLEYMLAHCAFPQTKQWVVLVAAELGFLQILQVFHKHYPDLVANQKQVVGVAMEYTNMQCIEYLLDISEDELYTVFTESPHKLICNFTVHQAKKIDLDKPVWRKLLCMNLDYHPQLQQHVEEKRDVLCAQTQECKSLLTPKIPRDIIEYCVVPFL